MGRICVYFEIFEDELLVNKDKSYRNIAIYLLKKHTGLTNRQIGELLGNISYLAVAKVYQRFSKKLNKDKALKKKIEEIMSNVKG